MRLEALHSACIVLCDLDWGASPSGSCPRTYELLKHPAMVGEDLAHIESSISGLLTQILL